jgi:pimeloyl-ACP methyl ester carboxylesterase
MTHQWPDRAEYPFAPNYFHINGHRLHYVDEGQGETVLFVHGTPSWSFDFRNVIKELSPFNRCVAVDHIGFGLSEKPEAYDYSTLNHSATLEKFVNDKQLDNITLVVHDFGGPIGLKFAIDHPERIRRLVIVNSWLWSSRNDPDFIRLSRVLRSPLLPFLYRYLNFSPRYLLPGSFGDRKLPKQLLRQYTMPFADRTQRNGPLAFAHSLLNDQEWFEELWQNRHVIANKPALIVWGMKDPVIRPHNLDKFLLGFGNATALRLEGSGHFPQEEEPEKVASSIMGFMQQNESMIR